MSPLILIEIMSPKTSLLIGLLLGLALGSVITFALVWGIAEQYRRRTSELEAVILELSSKIKELNEDLSSAKEKIIEHKGKVDQLESLVNELNSKLIKLNEELTVLRESTNVTIVLLPDREYYHTARKLIERANETIFVIIYVIKYDIYEEEDPVNILLRGLVKAKKRGLDVRVLVDDVTYKSYRQTISFLKEYGISVRLDESARIITHVKLVVIDHTYVLVGSHNWTESALSYNHEYSVLIVSQNLAENVEKYFESLWSKGRSP